MFHRRSTQKPSDDLYKKFKASFPQLPASAGHDDSANAVAALDIAVDHRLDTPNEIKDEPTPRGADSWGAFASSGLTPSLMDPNSHNFSMFANQLPGYYTPTPGGTNTFYHSQAAGDLHTPGLIMGMSTPLSLPTSEGGMQPGQQATGFSFQPHMAQQQQQQHFNQAVQPFQMHAQPQQSSYPPHHFTHQDSYDPLEAAVDDSPTGMGMDLSMTHDHSPHMLFHPQALHDALQPQRGPVGEKFRFHTTLNAPTAMVRQSDEIPITYLNKGQAYILNVMDTLGAQPSGPARYRTFVRVSFEDEQQRAKPAACWQLWKEGRGTNEAHQRGGRLQAVEYVEAGQTGGEDPNRPRVQLECASFDGFCVVWSPPPGTAECALSLRFNFLSTDFSHSKGVKGIPVRLCAKTERLDVRDSAADIKEPTGEVCFCKVKLFRDHGAERKLSNDVAHVKKTIDKVNAQIAQIEAGNASAGNKRKRGGSFGQRPAKLPKHRRTWSLSSATSGSAGGGGIRSAEDDLHSRLMNLQDMFTSTRPSSVLHLRGTPEDDPDLFPVKLAGESFPAALPPRIDSHESVQTGGTASSRDSRSASPRSGTAAENVNGWREPTLSASTTMDVDTNETIQPAATSVSTPPNTTVVPTKMNPYSPTTGAPTGKPIDVLGLSPSYTAPASRPSPRPVASLYILPRITGRAAVDPYHRAVYLPTRTRDDLVRAVALKAGIPPASVLAAIRVTAAARDAASTAGGLQVLLDDECVRELPEGAVAVAEFCEFVPEKSATGAVQGDSDGSAAAARPPPETAYELRLIY